MTDRQPLPSSPPKPGEQEVARPRADLPPAALRALAEAEARRAAHQTQKVHAGDLPAEVNGRKGAEPVRYGDWEKNGIVSDF